MPLSVLDPAAALIVIDLQKGIVALPTAHPAAEIIARSARLAAAFRAHGLPVVLVNVTATAPGRTDRGPRSFAFTPDWTDLVPELDAQAEDYRISKQAPGAFLNTALDATLRARGVTQVFLTGIATSSGVIATARSAQDLGYNVVFVTDAMTDQDLETHRFCLDKIFPKIGESDTTDAVLSLLAKAR